MTKWYEVFKIFNLTAFQGWWRARCLCHSCVDVLHIQKKQMSVVCLKLDHVNTGGEILSRCNTKI